MRGGFQDLWAHRELVSLLVQRTLRIRYKGTWLGFFWTLAAPLAMILIYATFLRIMKFAIPLEVLVTGIFVWQFLSLCLGDGLQAITGNASLIKKTAFPRIILPFSMALANLVNFLLSLVVLAALLLVLRPAAFGALYWLPLIILTQTALCLGLSLIVSAMNVFFRDTEHLLSLVTMAWFFMTPVIYPLEFPLNLIHERFPHFETLFRALLFSNPMTGLVAAYRGILISADPAPASGIALSTGMAWLMLVVGIAFFQWVQPRFADEL